MVLRTEALMVTRVLYSGLQAEAKANFSNICHKTKMNNTVY